MRLQFVIIAIITASEAISHLATHKFPEDSTPILVFSVISIIVLTAMSIYKLYLNECAPLSAGTRLAIEL